MVKDSSVHMLFLVATRHGQREVTVFSSSAHNQGPYLHYLLYAKLTWCTVYLQLELKLNFQFLKLEVVTQYDHNIRRRQRLSFHKIYSLQEFSCTLTKLLVDIYMEVLKNEGPALPFAQVLNSFVDSPDAELTAGISLLNLQCINL